MSPVFPLYVLETQLILKVYVAFIMFVFAGFQNGSGACTLCVHRRTSGQLPGQANRLWKLSGFLIPQILPQDERSNMLYVKWPQLVAHREEQMVDLVWNTPRLVFSIVGLPLPQAMERTEINQNLYVTKLLHKEKNILT